MSCALHGTNIPQPKTVSVNGVVVPRDTIASEMQHHPAKRPIDAWQAAARALVVRELLLQEARRLGLVAEPLSDIDGRRETEDEALIRAIHERNVVPPEADVATCRRYYDQNRSAFRSETLYEASHILFSARRDQARAYAEARGLAGSVIGELAQAPERFEEFAKAYSTCPSAMQGGNLGQIGTGQTTPEFERALSELASGETSPEPVETRYGFHIIRLDRRIEGEELPFELIADRIGDYLRESVTRRATAQFIARLVSRAEIVGVELAGAQAHRVN